MLSSSMGLLRFDTSTWRLSANETALLTSPSSSAPLKFFVRAAMRSHCVGVSAWQQLLRVQHKVHSLPTNKADGTKASANTQAAYGPVDTQVSGGINMSMVHRESRDTVRRACNVHSSVTRRMLTCELPQVHVTCQERVGQHLVCVDLQQTGRVTRSAILFEAARSSLRSTLHKPGPEDCSHCGRKHHPSA